MQKEDVLIDFGFSTNEAKVYLALLDTGLSTAGKIADKSKVHRTNVYDAIERLVQKGLVSYVVKDKTKYYEATEPENLMGILKERELQLEEIMPQLKLSGQLAGKKGEAHIYEGQKAFERILDHFLEIDDTILAYGISKIVPDKLKFFIPNYHKKRIAKKIVMKHIYNYDAQERIKYLNTLPFTEARSLPEKYNSDVTTNICGDEVIMTLWTSPVLVIQIKNRQIADSYRRYFNLLWKGAK